MARRTRRYGRVRRRFNRSRKTRKGKARRSKKRLFPARRRFTKRGSRKPRRVSRKRAAPGIAWGASRVGSLGRRKQSPSFAKKVFSALDSQIAPVDSRVQFMNIIDCGLGVQNIRQYASTGTTEFPWPIQDNTLASLFASTVDGEPVVSNGKGSISVWNTATTIYNPMNAPVHVRIEWITPRIDLDQRIAGWITDAIAAPEGFTSTFIGATYMDIPLIYQRWKYIRKPQSFWLAAGGSKTIYMKHLRSPLIVNLNQGRFQNNIGSLADENLFAVYKGLTKIMFLTMHGPISQNNTNTESETAQATYSNARLIVGTRTRIVFRPLLFSGDQDMSEQFNAYTQGFRTTYSNSGVPLISTRTWNAKLDDDDTRPSGFGTNAAIAAGDQRVYVDTT